MIRANGLGVSAYNESELKTVDLNGWAWRVKKGTALPISLKLVNDRPGHYVVAPCQDMPVDEYKGVLGKLVVHSEKAFKIEAKI